MKMLGDDYKRLAMRTNDGKASYRLFDMLKSDPLSNIDVGGVIDGCLGLSGEVGEFEDMIKKWIFQENDLDIIHAKKELGDVMWYVAMICHSFGWSLDEILQMNVDKLRARYPEGFSVEAANHRDKHDV